MEIRVHKSKGRLQKIDYYFLTKSISMKSLIIPSCIKNAKVYPLKLEIFALKERIKL